MPILAIALAGGAAPPVLAAESGWSTYANAAYGFSIEAPDALRLVGDPPTAEDPAPTVAGAADLGPRGRLGFFALRLAEDAAADPQAALKAQAEALAANDGGVIDAETPITVAGAPGLEIVLHNGDKSGRLRAVLRRGVLFLIMGVGPAGAPAEFERMESSLTFTPAT